MFHAARDLDEEAMRLLSALREGGLNSLPQVLSAGGPFQWPTVWGAWHPRIKNPKAIQDSEPTLGYDDIRGIQC